MKLKLPTALLMTSCLFSLEESPWLEFPYEFHFKTTFLESYYSEIQGATFQKKDYRNSWNEQFNLELAVTTLSMLDIALEGEFFQTKATSFTLESLASQLRWQVLDDIQGDPFSVALGGNLRFVPDHALRDPYVPYQGLINFEALLAVGKEFDVAFDWTKRFYVLSAVGIAIQGAPYLRVDARFDMHRKNHLFALLLNTNFGFGQKDSIDFDHFHGYADIWHQSLDLGVAYAYLFDIYGKLGIELSYRPYAKNFPKNFSKIEIRYDFPFSIF
jgi:hypothetical protein